MDDTAKRALLAFGLGTAGALALWGYWRSRRGINKEDEVPDAEIFQRRVAKVAKLYVYPVKSCHRIELPATHCGIRGLKYDRCWVVMNKQGRVVTQRWCPQLARITPRLEVLEEKVVLHLTAPGMPDLVVKEPPPNAATESVSVWDMAGEGVSVGREAGAWLDQFLEGEGYQLYYMAPQHKPRALGDSPVWKADFRKEQQTSFADLCPLLVLSEASMEVLNTWLSNPLPIERFRPNVIVTDCKAHEEDQWDEIRIGDSIILRKIKPCSRCKETTVDQEKGEFTGPEPLQTLRKYRLYEMVHEEKDSRYGYSPLFGSFFSILQAGPISVGDSVNSK